MVNIQDILVDTNNDLIIENNDFKVGDSTEQHQKHILVCAKGDFKLKPMVGVDVFNWLNDERPEDLMREIRLQFTNDGMVIRKMKVEYPSNVIIDAQYK